MSRKNDCDLGQSDKNLYGENDDGVGARLTKVLILDGIIYGQPFRRNISRCLSQFWVFAYEHSMNKVNLTKPSRTITITRNMNCGHLLGRVFGFLASSMFHPIFAPSDKFKISDN